MRRHRSFKYRGYTLVVDAEIIDRWSNAVTFPAKLRIWRSVREVYTRWLDEVKAAKFYPTAEGIRAELTLDILPTDKLPDIAAKLDDKSVKDQMLQLLKFTRYRQFNKSPLRNLFVRAVNHAAIDGDKTFFMRLGRILERKPVPFPLIPEPTPNRDRSCQRLDN